MKTETDNPQDQRFEAYLRQFQPAAPSAGVRARVLAAAGRRRVVRPLAWAAAAAAVFALCVTLAPQPRPATQPSAPALAKAPVAKKAPEPALPRTTGDMVRYGTMLAALDRGEDGLDRLLDEASTRILPRQGDNGRATAISWRKRM